MTSSDRPSDFRLETDEGLSASGDLLGKTAIVTGGSRGIGSAICLALAARGAQVAVNCRRESLLAEGVATSVNGFGCRAKVVQADVSDRDAVLRMVEDVSSSLGTPDILVNNAGVFHSGHLLRYSEEEFDRMWRVNVKGVLHCCEAAAPAMIAKGWGRIVNVASNAAVGTAMAGTTLYAATKGAVLSLTRRMAFELSPKGVTVNAVLPGMIETDMVTSGKTPSQLEELFRDVAGRALLGRVGMPAEIAALTGFLCSPKSSYMTGQFLMADGGRRDYLSHV